MKKDNPSQQKIVDTISLKQRKDRHKKYKIESLESLKTLITRWFNNTKCYYKNKNSLNDKREVFNFMIDHINHSKDWYANCFTSSDRKLYKTLIRLDYSREYNKEKPSSISYVHWDYEKFGFGDAIILNKRNNRRSWFITDNEWKEIIKTVKHIAPWVKRLIYASNDIYISKKDINNIINSGCELIGETNAKIYRRSFDIEILGGCEGRYIKHIPEEVKEFKGYEFII